MGDKKHSENIKQNDNTSINTQLHAQNQQNHPVEGQNRKNSVKEMIKQKERDLQKNKERGNALVSSKTKPRKSTRMKSRKFTFKPVRATPVAKAVPIAKAKPLPPMVAPRVRMEEFSKAGLQHRMPNTVALHNNRIKAKEIYFRKQRALREEYEAKLRQLHTDFKSQEQDLFHAFPIKKDPDQVKLNKLEKDAKAEKDKKLAEKLSKEADGLRQEIEARKPISEKEFSELSKMWFNVKANEWDAVCARSPRLRQDLFEKIRRDEDYFIASKVGTDSKGRKVNPGDCARWALNTLTNEEQNAGVINTRSKAFCAAMAKSACKIAGVNVNKTNKEKAEKIFKENDIIARKGVRMEKSALQLAAESLCPNGQLDPAKMAQLFEEESLMQRNVVLRVASVDRRAETVRLVMVLDRNGRPVIGGLPKDEVTPQVPPKPAPQAQPPPAPLPAVDAGESSDSGSEGSSTDGSASETSGESETKDENADDDHIEGYCSTETYHKGLEYVFSIQELLCYSGFIIIEDQMKQFLKDRYNNFVPRITYQRIAGFQTGNNNLNENNNTNNARRRRNYRDDPGDFQIVDLGVKLGLEPLVPIKDYEQEWRDGVLYNVRHVRDGNVRFVGYNETGFGFVEDRPIDMHVQKIVNEEDKTQGVNILHMTLFDTNEQVCFDTLYLKDEEDMEQNKEWKKFGKDAMGNRLAYRIVAQNGEIKKVLYPFQGRVKEAKLNVKEIELNEGDFVNVSVEGQVTRRLAKITLLPTGMVIGKLDEEKTLKTTPTPFLEMIRMRQRVMAEMQGLVDLEIYCEDDKLLDEPRHEAWPIECLTKADHEDMAFLKTLESVKEEVTAAKEREVLSLVEDVKSFVKDRTKRNDKEAFLQEATTLEQTLKDRKGVLESPEIVNEVEQALALLGKNIGAVKRALAYNRKSKKRQKSQTKSNVETQSEDLNL